MLKNYEANFQLQESTVYLLAKYPLNCAQNEQQYASCIFGAKDVFTPSHSAGRECWEASWLM